MLNILNENNGIVVILLYFLDLQNVMYWFKGLYDFFNLVMFLKIKVLQSRVKGRMDSNYNIYVLFFLIRVEFIFFINLLVQLCI